MFTVMVSIGRNVGNTPLSDRDWTFFQNDVADVIRREGEMPEIHTGRGLWAMVWEDSVHLTVYREFVTEGMRYAYREGLSRLASHYGQDAIALTISEPELVSPGRLH